MVSQPLSRVIEREADLGFARVRIAREQFSTPFEIRGRTNRMHCLQLSMLPFGRRSLGRYSDRWQPHRFEPIGDLFLLPANSNSHVVGFCREQRSLHCAIDPELARSRFGWDETWSDQLLERSLNIACAEAQRLLLYAVAELENPGLASETRLEALVNLAIVELGRHFQAQCVGDLRGGLAPWRMRLIEQEVAADPGVANVEAIARRCGLSSRQLSRAFHASRGQTLASYIATRRIDLAREMLSAGSSIKEAAYACGFSAPSNFATAFQREVGCSPSTFRARHLG